MTLSTAIILVLLAIAAVFTTLFLRDRNEWKKADAKSEKLSAELTELKIEKAREESLNGEYMKRLSGKVITHFLKNEKGIEIVGDEEDGIIPFTVDGNRYQILVSRLPQQLAFRSGYNMEGVKVNWDVLQQAAIEVTSDIVMAKVNVYRDLSYEFVLVTTDRTLGSLRENFNFYLNVLNDTERRCGERYWEILEKDYPEEYQAELAARESREAQQEGTPQDVTPQGMEDMALKLAKMGQESGKMRS